MDLVSNLANTVLSKAMEGNSQENTAQIDLNDETFSNLLDKQLNNRLEQNGKNFVDTLGIPSISGINLGEYDGHNIGQTDLVQPVSEFDNAQSEKFKSGKDFSMEEVLTLFSPIFESKPNMAEVTNNGIFDFERKTAANLYNRYAKNVITDLSEFVTDALKIS